MSYQQQGWGWTFYCCQKPPSRGVLQKGVLKICSKFTGEYLCRSAISVKPLYKFIEIILRHGCSPVSCIFSEHLFLRTPPTGCFCTATLLTSNYVYFYETYASYTFYEIYLCFRILIYLYEFIHIFVFIWFLVVGNRASPWSSRPEVFLGKRCFENMQQIYRRTPMPKCNFNKVTIQQGCSPVKMLHIFRTPFLRSYLEGCFKP